MNRKFEEYSPTISKKMSKGEILMPIKNAQINDGEEIFLKELTRNIVGIFITAIILIGIAYYQKCY